MFSTHNIMGGLRASRLTFFKNDEIKIDIDLASGPFEKNVILEATKTHPNIFEVDIGSK